jgi:hypothetical protein
MGLHMKKFAALSISALILASCAADPTVVEVQQLGDSGLNCEQLNNSIQEAQGYKTAAREDDKFELKYIWLPTGALSAYRFNKAEGHAQDRIEYLTSMSSQKGCGAPRQSKMMFDSTNKGGQIPNPAPQDGNINMPTRPRR